MSERKLRLGNIQELSSRGSRLCELPLHHLTTHAVVFGGSGSGKTGHLMVLTEEVLRSGVPVLMIDVKGDLPNLALSFPDFEAESFEPWVEPSPGDTRSKSEIAAALATERREALAAWDVLEHDVQTFRDQIALRVITPGSTAGEPLDILSSLESAAANWKRDPESARASLSAGVSLVLRLLDLDPDPAKSRAHVILSLFAENRIEGGLPSGLGDLVGDLLDPPIAMAGALPINTFMSVKERTPGGS